jgi:hypothetical protein
MKHLLFSQNKDLVVQWFDKYDRKAILNAIVTHLTTNPTDTLEHCKECSKSDLRRFLGNEILSFYEVNPKNGKISKVITRNNKDVYLSLTNN